MTGVHEPGIVSEVEPVRLFYRWVKLTMPFDLLRQILLNFDSRQAQYVHILSFCPVLRASLSKSSIFAYQLLNSLLGNKFKIFIRLPWQSFAPVNSLS